MNNIDIALNAKLDIKTKCIIIQSSGVLWRGEEAGQITNGRSTFGLRTFTHLRPKAANSWT